MKVNKRVRGKQSVTLISRGYVLYLIKTHIRPTRSVHTRCDVLANGKHPSADTALMNTLPSPRVCLACSFIEFPWTDNQQVGAP